MVGLLLSVAWHVGLLLGRDFFGAGGIALFVGVFVVWFPTVIQLQRTGAGGRFGSDWKTWLAGGPPWLYPLVIGIFVYAMINFGLGFLGVYSMEGTGFWRMASGHAMAFYSAGWGFAYAANRREELGLDWRCQHGHEMPPGAKFCAECGAPAMAQRIVPKAGA